MKFVCNSSVLIFLAKLDALYLLKKDFLIVPKSVRDELLAKESTEKDQLELFLREKHIVITKPKNIRITSKALGKGEIEVIALAFEKKIPYVLMDDRRACSLAKSSGLIPKGTLWIIFNSIKKRRLKKTQAKQYLYDLPGYGFRIDEALLMELLKKLEKNP